MMNVKRITLVILILICSLYIAGYSVEASAVDSIVSAETKGYHQGKDTSGYPVIGYLKKRDKIITIKKGPNGPLYSVETKDGKILAKNLPAEKLYAEFPDLKYAIEKGLAIQDAAYR